MSKLSSVFFNPRRLNSAIDASPSSKNWGWKLTVYPLSLGQVSQDLSRTVHYRTRKTEARFLYGVSVLRLLEKTDPAVWVYSFRPLFRLLMQFFPSSVPTLWRLTVMTVLRRLLVIWVDYVEVYHSTLLVFIQLRRGMKLR